MSHLDRCLKLLELGGELGRGVGVDSAVIHPVADVAGEVGHLGRDVPGVRSLLLGKSLETAEDVVGDVGSDGACLPVSRDGLRELTQGLVE